MNYLLDTNVVSEFAKDRPSPRVIDWLRATAESSLFLSSLSIGEIRTGIEKLPDSKRRQRLRLWLEELVQVRFALRTLAVDVAVGERWGRLVAEVGRTVPAIDALLAATALEHNLTLATRNTKDFERLPGLVLFNPWEY